jgi:hypothetical protein
VRLGGRSPVEEVARGIRPAREPGCLRRFHQPPGPFVGVDRQLGRAVIGGARGGMGATVTGPFGDGGQPGGDVVVLPDRGVGAVPGPPVTVPLRIQRLGQRVLHGTTRV